MRNRRRPPAIDPRGFLAACLAAAVLLAALTGWMRTARADTPLDWLLFERLTERRAQDPVPQRFTLRGHVFSLYPANREHPALMLVERRGRIVHLASADLYKVLAFHEGSADGPDLLVEATTGGSDGDTLHAFALRDGFSIQTIGRGDTFAGVEAGDERAVERIVFSDRAFAGWNSPLSAGPAPAINLVWEGRRFVVDTNSVGRAPTSPRRLQRYEAEMRTALENWRQHGGAYVPLGIRTPDDVLSIPPVQAWRSLLVLIYAGEAAVARDMFRRAWPDDLAGKAAFWDDFRRRLRGGEMWRNFDLETALQAGVLFDGFEPQTN
ncbi:MAG: hypothetical protein JNL71_03295 [Rhodospirillales bacterium]|nr:hypothetical protein [Rhodospirillales bacterium]